MDKIIIKECPKHGFTEYVLRADGRYRCKKCSSEAVSAKRRKNKLMLVEYKGGKCEICGYDKCIDALEFHHINPKEKEIPIGSGDIKSFDKLKKEVDKCILVCSNCHKELHSKINNEIQKEKLIEEELNVKKYKNSGKKTNLKIIDKISKEDILGLLKNNTQKQIAEKYGISVSTVKRILKA
jgi:5-methylcytosine-specific restriction endonuclease McrA